MVRRVLARTLAVPAFALLAALAVFVACNQGSDRDDEPLIDLTDLGFPGLDAGAADGSGNPFEDGVGDGTCDIPCLFGTTCVEGQCVLPCDPECASFETCIFGVCVAETGATCDPPCRDSQVCVGEDVGTCVDANECDPPCADGEQCLRGGGCLPADACDADNDCAGDQRCVGGACLDPISPDDWEAEGATGYAVEVTVPGVLVDRCCFDLNGDGFADNALAGFAGLTSVLGGAPLDEAYEDALADGTVGYGFDLEALDGGRADLSVLEVSPDVDGDGEPDTDWD